jgi:transposase
VVNVDVGIDTLDPAYYIVGDGDGQTTTACEAGLDVGGDPGPAARCRTPVLHPIESDPRSADFDGYVERLCQRFYADDGRPGLPPGRYFRLLLIGYFEGLDAERAIAWRAADSFALREFLGLVLPEAPPDHSTISRTRRLIDLETHQAVFPWILQRLADVGLVKKMELFDYIEVFYNQRRRHSTLGQISPAAFERQR